MAEEPLPPKHTFIQYCREYILLLWDGFTFFGFDDTKLGRINGAPVTFLDKFKSKRWITFTFSGMAVILTVLILEIKNLGQQKSQTVQLIEDFFFNYDLKDSLPLLFANYYYVDEIFPRIQEYQRRTEFDPNAIKHPKLRLLPLRFDDWD